MFRGADDKDYWAEWLPVDYLIENADTQECQICIYPHSSSDLILGSSFLRGYYAKFDKTAGTVGLVPNTASTKEDLTEGTAPTRLRGYDTGTVAGLSVGLAVELGLFLWIIIGVFCYTIKRAPKKTETVKIDSDLAEQLATMLEEAKKKESGQQQLTNIYQINSIE